MHGVMTGLAVVTGLLTLVLYVAFRRARPAGVALDPWPYVLSRDPGTRFMMNLPEPGEPICDREPPAELLRDLARQRPLTFVGITRCYYRPHPRMRGIAHVGILIERNDPHHLAGSYTWLEDGKPPTPYVQRRRFGRVRRAVLRWAAG